MMEARAGPADTGPIKSLAADFAGLARRRAAFSGSEMSTTAIISFTIDAYDAVRALWERCEGVGLHDDCDSLPAVAEMRGLPRLSYNEVRHWIVLCVERKHDPAGTPGRGRKKRIIDINSVARIPLPEQPAGFVNQRLVDRLSPELRKKLQCPRLFLRSHEEHHFRTLHCTCPELILRLVAKPVQETACLLLTTQVPNQNVRVNERLHF